MPHSNSRAQAGLEYLVTYGWAFVLLVTIASIVFFVFSPPKSTPFSSSDPTKIIVRDGTTEDNVAKVELQNATGGNITIIPPEGCTINGVQSPNPVVVPAGGLIALECEEQTIYEKVLIDYTDPFGIEKTVYISGGGGEIKPGCNGDGDCPPGICCSRQCIQPACSADGDCDDHSPCTGDVCSNPGTCSSQCTNEKQACMVLNSATNKNCSFFCQLYGVNCQSVGTNGINGLIGTYTVAIPVGHCSNGEGNCDTPMVPIGTMSCFGHKITWTYCYCVP